MSSSASSNSTETITNVVFGLTATTISIVTVWQGHKVWKTWREHVNNQENVAPDIELGLQSFQSTPPSLGAQERAEHEEVDAGSAPSANQVGQVAESDQMPVSVQRLELQPTLPTTVDAEASLSPTLVQGDSNQSPRIRVENAPPALTDVERRELHPTANDHL